MCLVEALAVDFGSYLVVASLASAGPDQDLVWRTFVQLLILGIFSNHG